MGGERVQSINCISLPPPPNRPHLPFGWRSRLGQLLLTAPTHVRLPERAAHAVCARPSRTTSIHHRRPARRHHARIWRPTARERTALRHAGRRLRRAQMRRRPALKTGRRLPRLADAMMAVRRGTEHHWAVTAIAPGAATAAATGQRTQRCGLAVETGPARAARCVRVAFLGEAARHVGAATAAGRSIGGGVLFVPVGDVEALQ